MCLLNIGMFKAISIVPNLKHPNKADGWRLWMFLFIHIFWNVQNIQNYSTPDDQLQSIKHLFLSWLICSITFYFLLLTFGLFSSDGCSCNAGWHGDDCSSSCPRGFYGAGCSHPCSCLSGADCDPVKGACLCPPGHTGTLCQDGMWVFIQLLYMIVCLYSLVKLMENWVFVFLLLYKKFLKDVIILASWSDEEVT